MPLTVSTPYKSNTFASTTGAASDEFNSNGTPFAAGDVGRCIVMTSGAAIGCIRKIVGYIDNNSVRLDYPFGVSPFASFRNSATGLAFSESSPAPGDSWQMSYAIDDLDDGTNIVKHSDDAYTFVANQTVAFNGVFVYDANKSLTMNSNVLRPNASSFIRFGDINQDGRGKNGCQIVDVSTGSSGFSGSTTAGDFHFYGGTIRASGASHFWRLYRGAAQITRIVDARVNGTFGCRLQGSQSLLLRVQWDDCNGQFGPFNTIPPFGGTYDCSVSDSPRAIFWNPDNGPDMDARGLTISRLSSFLISAGGSVDTGSITLRDMDFSALAALPALYGNSGAKPNTPLTFTQRLRVSAVNAALAPVTDSLHLRVTNAQGTEVVSTTTSSGTFADVDLVARQFLIGSTGNHTWSEGTSRSPFAARLLAYAWQEASITLPMLLPSTWAATLLPDTRVSAASAAAAIAVAGIAVTQTAITITASVTVQQVFDYAKATRVANPAWPNILPGELGDFGTMDIIVSGATLTGDFETAGTVTTPLGGLVNGIYTDATGRHVTISAPALIAGSRVQLYDLTSSIELYNGVLAATGLLLPVVWSADHTIRLRAEHADKLALQTVGVLSSSGLTFLDVQADDTVYLGNAIDGSTCTEFAADGANVQVDIADPDGVTSVQRLYAWAQWYQTTAAGIASQFFGAVQAIDAATYVIDQALADIHLDNVQATPVRVVGGYLARKDGSTVIATGSGSIQMDPGKAYVAGVDGLARESTAQTILALSLG